MAQPTRSIALPGAPGLALWLCPLHEWPTPDAQAWLDADELRARVDSPTYLAGMHDPDAAILEPARLAWGLRDACLSRGVRIAEGTRATELRETPHGVAVGTSQGDVLGRQVVLATNAYRPLLRRLRLMTVPVWDYALMTEPLTEAQRAAIGWEGREGIGDAVPASVSCASRRSSAAFSARISWARRSASACSSPGCGDSVVSSSTA